MSNELEELSKTKAELFDYIKGFLNNRQLNNTGNDNRNTREKQERSREVVRVGVTSSLLRG